MASSNKRGTILVVDDDKMTLTLLAKILERAFEVVKFTDAEDALKIISEGLKPGVIISDIYMPNMNGDEFLEKTIPLLPTTTRIILTGNSEPKEVIPFINRSKSLMYIKKQWNDLELFQAAVISYDRYEMTEKVNYYTSFINEKKIDSEKIIQLQAKKLNELQETMNIAINQMKDKDLKIKELGNMEKQIVSQVEELKLITQCDSNTTVDTDKKPNPEFESTRKTVLALSAYIDSLDRFSFINSSYHIAILCKDIALKLELNHETLENVTQTSLLSFFPNTIMPNELQIVQPFLIEQKERDKFLYYFNKSLRILNNFYSLEKFTNILSKIWENKSGFGFPKRLSGNAVPIESQIIGISMLYIVMVYRLSEKGLKTLKQTGKILQTPDDTRIRHKLAVEYIQKNRSWYDDLLNNAFNMLVKQEASYTLIPKSSNLEINLMDKKGLGESKKHELLILDYFDPELLLDIKTSANENLYVSEKEIKASDLDVNMTVSRNIFSEDGSIVVPAKTEITEGILRNYRQLISKSMIKDSIWIVKQF